MDPIKSIAIPVARKRISGKPKRSGGAAPVHADLGGMRRASAVATGPRHKYSVGERVTMKGGSHLWARSESVCSIVGLLPHEGGPLRYRVRGDAESFERVIEEVDLDRLP